MVSTYFHVCKRIVVLISVDSRNRTSLWKQLDTRRRCLLYNYSNPVNFLSDVPRLSPAACLLLSLPLPAFYRQDEDMTIEQRSCWQRFVILQMILLLSANAARVRIFHLPLIGFSAVSSTRVWLIFSQSVSNTKDGSAKRIFPKHRIRLRSIECDAVETR